jgi:hypothetical protein
MASGSLATRSVDIAVLCNDISRPVVLDDSVTVIDLAPICPPLSISNFMKMFYKNGPAAKFSMLNDTDTLSATSQIGDGTYSSFAQNNYAVSETGLVAIPLNDYVSFSGQTLEGAGGNNSAFNLKKAILGAYSSNESGVGVDSNCWAPCSLMAIQTQMNKLKHLYDICNVECSRTFYEAMQEISSLFDGDGGSSVVNTRVSVVFTNQNPVVQDVIVRFNFQVELLCVNAKPLIDTPLSSLYDGIDNVPVFRNGELIGSQPLKSAVKCGNPTAAEMVKGSDSLAYFFNKSVALVGQSTTATAGPSDKYWTPVLDSTCLPECFPFDISTRDVYVLSVKLNAVSAALPLPLPVILTQSHKFRDARLHSTTQACDQIVVVNVYINLACGRKAAYFPANGNLSGTGYDGIDPADIFLHPRGAISVSGVPDPAPAVADVGDVINVGTLSLDLTSSKLLPTVPPACVGDLYLLGTQVNLFLQHVVDCNIENTPKTSYSPILGINGSSVDAGNSATVNDYLVALEIALGNLTTASTLHDTAAGALSEFSWGLDDDTADTGLDFIAPSAKKAFTKAELACKPFAMVITDVCALPSN